MADLFVMALVFGGGYALGKGYLGRFWAWIQSLRQ